MESNSFQKFSNTYPNIKSLINDKVWKCIRIQFDLENFILKLPVSTISFINSSFVYEIFSDATKLIDLVSQKIELNNVITKKFNDNSLQFEICYRSTKTYNKYSILCANTRWIFHIDWLINMKEFLVQNASNPTILEHLPIEVKLNLKSIDLVFHDNTYEAVVRTTGFFEYNENQSQTIESSLHSIELFTCIINEFENTSIPIIEPTMVNFCWRKNQIDVLSDIIRLRLSYLDFKFFSILLDSVKSKFPKQNKENENRFIALNVKIRNFNFYINDDFYIPLMDIQLSKFNLYNKFKSQHEGSAEFSLKVNYFNRLLSGWEPLLESWLSCFNWKLKADKNVLTLTSPNILNVNLTNTFIMLINDVLSKWGSQNTKQHNAFKPYKIVNIIGKELLFMDPISLQWICLKDKEEKEFSFVVNKIKQTNSPNRIRVKMDGWSEIRPLAVDKVGTYFREVINLLMKGNI